MRLLIWLSAIGSASAVLCFVLGYNAVGASLVGPSFTWLMCSVALAMLLHHARPTPTPDHLMVYKLLEAIAQDKDLPLHTRLDTLDAIGNYAHGLRASLKPGI